MERLTYFDGVSYQDLSSKVECVQKLGVLEDLEKQGLLIKLPCKVGDMVYVVRTDINEIEEIEITGFCFGKAISWFEYMVENYTKYLNCGLLGRTVFLTKEEAEQALKEREGNV